MPYPPPLSNKPSWWVGPWPPESIDAAFSTPIPTIDESSPTVNWVSETAILDQLSEESPLAEAAQGYFVAAKKAATTKKTKPIPKDKNYNLSIRELWPFVLDNKHDNQKPMPYIPPENLIGMEIECEGEHLFKTPTLWWLAKGDHSLRGVNGHEPVEYVLRSPVKRDEVEEALDYILKRLTRKKTVLSLSERCSVHVHFNCQKMLMKQVLTFALLYIVVEELMVEWCGSHRVGNMFCLRAVDAHNLIATLEECIKADDYRPLSSDNVRYTSCNMAALSKFGSLEFRALRGTTDRQTILNWIDMLLSIRKASLQFDDPADIVTAFESLGPDRFLHWVLGPFAELFPNEAAVRSRIWNGIRLIKEIVYVRKWEDPIKKRKSRKKGEAA